MTLNQIISDLDKQIDYYLSAKNKLPEELLLAEGALNKIIERLDKKRISTTSRKIFMARCYIEIYQFLLSSPWRTYEPTKRN